MSGNTPPKKPPDVQALREWAEHDWGDALRLAQLWAGYWEGDAITRLDLGQAGFLARSFLAALAELHGKQADLAFIAEAASSFHKGEDGKARVLAVIAERAGGVSV